MPKKALAIIVLLLAVGGAAFYFRSELGREIARWQTGLPRLEDPGIEMLRQDLEQRVFTPAPFRAALDKEADAAYLTVQGIIAETNRWRRTESLGSLTEAAGLRRAAEIKLKDMFDKQYFAHEAPNGDGPADLADQAGYRYIVIGENLALGNFATDTELVQGWMDSPGHRANIMNSSYAEIGVAVGKGMYEGRMTWLAVQEFGLPAAACPAPDQALEASIADRKARIAELEPRLEQKKRELDQAEANQSGDYNRHVQEYNALVEQYNALVRETKALVETYNGQAAGYNACLKQATGS